MHTEIGVGDLREEARLIVKKILTCLRFNLLLKLRF
jgi:hypothetical protein